MKKIKVLLDRHFPYDASRLNTSDVKTKKIKLKTSLPRFLQRAFHVGDLYVRSFKSDVILGNRRTALMLGLLYRLYKPSKVSLVGYEIIFNFKNNLRSRAVTFVWRLAMGKIDKLIVQANSERGYLARQFRASPERFKTIPFYSEEEEFQGPFEGGFVFAAGRMERDFITLLQALQQTKLPAVIVADQSLKEVLEPLKSDKVTIYYNIPKEKYLSLLQQSRLVVVPLYQGAASRGQVVILEAMKYGKPVICSNVPGTVDYIEEGKTGLLTEPQNSTQLRSLLEQYFPDFEALKALGRNAFEAQRNLFAPHVFYKNYVDTIHELYEAKNGHLKAPRIKAPDSSVPV